MRLGLATCLCLFGFATSGLAGDRPNVILYTADGCRPCLSALESLRELGIEPTVTRDCPAWVTQVPVIHWRDRAGVWRQHAPQHWSGPNWSELETEKIRRWLLPSSATKSTARDPYLVVTALADTREAAAPGPKVSNQQAGMKSVTLEEFSGCCINDCGKLLLMLPESDPRRGFVLTAIHALESI